MAVKKIVLSHTVIIYMKIFKKYVQLNLRYLYINYPIKYLNVKNDDVINGNEISTYYQSHGGNEELKCFNGNYHIINDRNH